ncbi:MAG: DUF7121 family protein [Candidatus Hodarchaeales archaeon]|jgi:uncharacterized coiled-coil DUF342 family protein
MAQEAERKLKEHYAEQNRLKNEIGELWEKERELSRETSQRRSKRDEIKQKRQALLSQARKAKELRDEINRQVGDFKQARETAVDRSRQLRQTIAGKHESSEYDLLSVVELRYRLYELEYSLQTRPHSPNLKKDQMEEKELLDQIAVLEETIERRVAEGKLDGLEASPPSEDVTKELEDLKSRAQTSHEEMLLLVERGQKEHVQVSRMFDEVSRLQDEENEFHQAFVESLNALEETTTTIESHQKRLDVLKDEITDLRIHTAESKEKERIDATQKQVDALLTKKRGGKELTPEEMEFLMAHGESPF